MNIEYCTKLNRYTIYYLIIDFVFRIVQVSISPMFDSTMYMNVLVYHLLAAISKMLAHRAVKRNRLRCRHLLRPNHRTIIKHKITEHISLSFDWFANKSIAYKNYSLNRCFSFTLNHMVVIIHADSLLSCSIVEQLYSITVLDSRHQLLLNRFWSSIMFGYNGFTTMISWESISTIVAAWVTVH